MIFISKWNQILKHEYVSPRNQKTNVVVWVDGPSSDSVMTLDIRVLGSYFYWQLFLFISLWTAHSHWEHMNSIVKWLFFQTSTAPFLKKETFPINDASLFFFLFFFLSCSMVDMLQINIQQQFKTIIHFEMSSIEVLSNKHFT